MYALKVPCCLGRKHTMKTSDAMYIYIYTVYTKFLPSKNMLDSMHPYSLAFEIQQPWR